MWYKTNNHQAILAKNCDLVCRRKPKATLGSGKCGGCDFYPLDKFIASPREPRKSIDEHNMILEWSRETKRVVQEERPRV